MFVDNCPAHPKVLSFKFKAIKIVHLPPNMTSKVQPMDMEIIKNTKFYYRKRLLEKIIKAMSENCSFNIDLLQAIILLTKAWDDVKSSKISNCFRKAGFQKKTAEVDESPLEIDGELEKIICEPSVWIDLSKKLGCEGVSSSSIDEYVMIADRLSDADILEMVSQKELQEG